MRPDKKLRWTANMSLMTDIVPQSEASLRERASLESRDTAEVTGSTVDECRDSVPDTVLERTTGERILAELRYEAVLGLWLDRPEDSVTLARELRKLAEARGVCL